jgi:hypothetical protein
MRRGKVNELELLTLMQMDTDLFISNSLLAKINEELPEKKDQDGMPLLRRFGRR